MESPTSQRTPTSRTRDLPAVVRPSNTYLRMSGSAALIAARKIVMTRMPRTARRYGKAKLKARRKRPELPPGCLPAELRAAFGGSSVRPSCLARFKALAAISTPERAGDHWHSDRRISLLKRLGFPEEVRA